MALQPLILQGEQVLFHIPGTQHPHSQQLQQAI